MCNGIPFTIKKVPASSEALKPGPLDQNASAQSIELPGLPVGECRVRDHQNCFAIEKKKILRFTEKCMLFTVK